MLTHLRSLYHEAMLHDHDLHELALGSLIISYARRKATKNKKILAFHKIIVYTKHCCDIDSVEA